MLNAADPDTADWLDATRPARRRRGWVVLFVSILTIGVYTIGWLYRLQQEHPRRRGVDPAAGVWLGVFCSLTIVMFAVLGMSGYGQWSDWRDASGPQQWFFLVGLGVALLFNLWFAVSTMKLTTRFQSLLHQPPGAPVPMLQRFLLVAGVVAEAIAVVGPALIEVDLVPVPTTLAVVPDVLGSLGTGSLFAWAIVLHRQANELAAADEAKDRSED